MRPEQELTRGDLSAADRAYEEALSYALGYPPDSEVRGAMFCQLGLYLMARGRRREADVMLQDGVSILKRHSDKNPLDYHIALNNLAIFQTEGREFEAAQRTLEKALDAGPVLRKAHAESPELELVLHLNLVNLLVNMRCLDQARPLLIEAERLLGTVGQSSRQAFRIKFLENRSLWHCAIGDYAAASSDASDAGQTESAAFLWVQAKVHLARNEFAQAEPLLRQSRELVGKTKTLHCPENLEPTLDLAEAQFGQAKHSDAFATLQDARSIVADFALPPDAIWKKSLETWLQRARDVGKMDIATTLQAELATIPAAANQAFTVLEKFRISDDATGG
jgi:tetratricopeptide (TPR) repeat protein